MDLIILIFIGQGFFIFHLKGNGQYVKAKKESQIEDERKGRESKFLTLKYYTGFYKTLKLFTEPASLAELLFFYNEAFKLMNELLFFKKGV